MPRTSCEQPQGLAGVRAWWALMLTARRGYPPFGAAYQRREVLLASYRPDGTTYFRPLTAAEPGGPWGAGAYGQIPTGPALQSAPTSGHMFLCGRPNVLGDIPPIRYRRVYPRWPNARPSYDESGIAAGPLGPRKAPAQQLTPITFTTLNGLGFVPAGAKDFESGQGTPV